MWALKEVSASRHVKRFPIFPWRKKLVTIIDYYSINIELEKKMTFLKE